MINSETIRLTFYDNQVELPHLRDRTQIVYDLRLRLIADTNL